MFLKKEKNFNSSQKQYLKIPGYVVAYWVGEAFAYIFSGKNYFS